MSEPGYVISRLSKSWVKVANRPGEWRRITVGGEGKALDGDVASKVRRSVQRSRQLRQNGDRRPERGSRGADAVREYRDALAEAKALRAGARAAGRVPSGSQADEAERVLRSRRAYANRSARNESKRARQARRSSPEAMLDRHRRQQRAEYENVRLSRRQGLQLLVLPATSVVAAEEAMSKSSSREADAVLGGASGLAASTAGMTAAGFSAKKGVARLRYERLKDDPEQAAKERRVWDEHKRAHAKDWDTSRKFRRYPKEIAEWRLQRALGWKNHPAVAGGVAVGSAAAGAKWGWSRGD